MVSRLLLSRRGGYPGLWAVLLVVLATASTTVYANQQQPFWPVQTAAPLAKRQGCLANFFSCADLGPTFNGVCCQSGQRCAVDASNNPACCPQNAVCTGTAPGSFVPPTTTAASFVPNPYFSFPYLATYFANAGDCSAAVTQCGSNYAACTAQLAGAGGYGVTIVVPGGAGTTITGGGVNYGPASATSICNSLAQAACHGLQASMCTLTATSTNGFSFGNGATNAAARPTAGCVGLAGAMAIGAMGLGIVNAF
ncbi:hypothetical protein B0H63DRAFT_517649 [Podospora didyma]|uniref:GPI-anchored protein n=1 Tax=Podospora didyma TaxID=330526 RepID=A0AAE0P747_9PEZI|nr:hypothetical protein B0H63DRAFT_517649 [Podospora didyma]